MKIAALQTWYLTRFTLWSPAVTLQPLAVLLDASAYNQRSCGATLYLHLSALLSRSSFRRFLSRLAVPLTEVSGDLFVRHVVPLRPRGVTVSVPPYEEPLLIIVVDDMVDQVVYGEFLFFRWF